MGREICRSKGKYSHICYKFYVGWFVPSQPTNYYDTISLGYLSTGNYDLIYSLSYHHTDNDCLETDYTETHSISFFIDRFLSVNNFEKLKFNLYPNPTAELVNIEFELSNKENFTMEIYDMQGVKIATPQIGSKEQGNHKISVNTAHLSSGMYIVKLHFGEEMITKKFMKK